MIWFLTFINNSPHNTSSYFSQFSLQKRDQINYPTSGEQTYYATGQGIDQPVDLQPNKSASVTLTFSFEPFGQRF
jgi:hypothetical protein